MTSIQIFSVEGKDAEVVRLIVGLDLIAVSTANVIFSAVTTFASNSQGRAFSAAPKVIGINVPVAGMIANAITTTTGISIYARGLSDTAVADATVQVTATLEGRLV